MNFRFVQLLTLLLISLCFGCNTTKTQAVIRPLHERFLGKMTHRSNVRGKKDIAFTRNSIEAAIRFSEDEEGKAEQPFLRYPEIYVNLGHVDIDDREGETSFDADGYEIGLGIKSPPPTRPGWGMDYDTHIGYFSADFDHHSSGGIRPAWSYNGPTSDFRLGGHYAIDLGNSYLLSPSGGVFYKTISDEWEWLDELYDDDGSHTSAGDPDNSDKDDFHLYSLGLYVGLKLNHASLDHFDVSVNYFKGFSSVSGIRLDAGFRF